MAPSLPNPFDGREVTLTARQIHDLRGPIAVTRTLLAALTQGAVGPLSEPQADIIARAERRLAALQSQVDELVGSTMGSTTMGSGLVLDKK